MARVNIPVNILPANGGAVQCPGVAADPTNDHELINDGQTFLIAQNSNAAAQSATIISVRDPYSRLGDTSISIPASAGGFDGIAVAGPFARPIWNQGGGSLVNIDTAALAADVKFCAFKFVF